MSHLLVVFGQTACAGFLVERGEVVPRLFHHFDKLVEAYTVHAVGKAGVYVGVESAGGGLSVALYAGHLKQSAHRVAGHA